MKRLLLLCLIVLPLPPPAMGAEPVAALGTPAAAGMPESLAMLVRKIRPGFRLGSMAGGLDFTRADNHRLVDFFRRNFNAITVGVYMKSTQREPGSYNFERTDALIAFAQQNKLQVHLHPLVGGAEYTPEWVNAGGFSAAALQELLRERITTILTRYRGRIHLVDVVNEALTGTGRRPDGSFAWQEKTHRGEPHVWMNTLGLYRGKEHTFPRYLVDAFRIAREAAGPEVKLILNEWANETTKASRASAFLGLMQALREEGVPVDAAGLQLHCRLRNGRLHGWASNAPFDFEAFSEMMERYEAAGIDVHITEFDIHLPPDPTAADFEAQGSCYAEILRRALQSPAVKSFKYWGFTDRHSWRADGVDGRPLMLDENLQPKPAYRRQVEMLRELAIGSRRAAKPGLPP